MYKIIGADQKQYGPVSAEEVRRWLAEGRLNGQSLAQPAGSEQWVPLNTLPEFADALRAHIAPPPPAASAPGAPMPRPQLETWTAEILARQAHLPIGQCLSRSWHLFTSNFGFLFGATMILWLIRAVCERIPLVGMFYWIFDGVFSAGLYLVFLRKIRGHPATIGDVFAGFSLAFVQLLLAGFLTSLLSWIAMFCCILPGLYLFVAWILAVPLVIDKGLEFWTAMELSRKIVTRVWFEMLGLLIVCYLPTLLAIVFAGGKLATTIIPDVQNMVNGGQPDPNHMMQLMLHIVKVSFPLWIITKVVLLLNLPFAVGARMYAYEDLFGARPPATS